MAIVESRLKDGMLTLGTTPAELDFSCQVTNARINSSYDDDGDAVETLCGDQIPAGRKLGGRAWPEHSSRTGPRRPPRVDHRLLLGPRPRGDGVQLHARTLDGPTISG